MESEPVLAGTRFEQRRHPRVDIFQEVACEADGVVCRSRAADLSIGGMFVDLPRTPFTAGMRVRVCFALQSRERPVVAQAAVHYVQDGIGMGLRFVDLEAASRERIAAFVDERLHRKRVGPTLRKSVRVSIRVPVRLRGECADGAPFDEHAHIVSLSKHGACVESAYVIAAGSMLRVEIPRGREFKGSVVWVGTAATRNEAQVGIQCRGLAQALGFQFP